MNRILAILALSSLCSCLATQAAVDNANIAAANAKHAAEQASNAAANPDVTQAELDAVIAMAVANAEAALEAAAAIPAAIKADIEQAKLDAGGLLGSGNGGPVGGAIGLAGVLLSWYLRDRRYKDRAVGGPGYQGPGDTVPPPKP